MPGLLLGLALAGCEPAPPMPSTVLQGGVPDAILLRFPADGEVVTAYEADLDSVIWRARTAAPPDVEVIGFDDLGGQLLARDSSGAVLSLDLRLGTMERFGTTRLVGEIRGEGGAAFGVDSLGRVVRVTPAGTWGWSAPDPVRQLVPLPDGALLVLADLPGGTTIRRLFPPETAETDRAEFPTIQRVLRTSAGDRLWIQTAEELVALRTRDLRPDLSIPIGDSVTVLAATPSGDRLFLGSVRDAIRIIDRFAEREIGRIDLPAPPVALRMDPDGAYLLARTTDPEMIHVIAIGTMRVVASLEGTWRDDLPTITPAGHLIFARDADLVVRSIPTGAQVRLLRGAAADRWQLLRWNGFRPRVGTVRAVGADDAVPPPESLVADPVPGEPPVPPPGAAETAELPSAAAQPSGPWHISFATLTGLDRAQELAREIRVDGRTARVLTSDREGTPIHRVLMGPFESRDAAERAGMRSGRAFWVFEGTP